MALLYLFLHARCWWIIKFIQRRFYPSKEVGFPLYRACVCDSDGRSRKISHLYMVSMTQPSSTYVYKNTLYLQIICDSELKKKLGNCGEFSKISQLNKTNDCELHNLITSLQYEMFKMSQQF